MFFQKIIYDNIILASTIINNTFKNLFFWKKIPEITALKKVNFGENGGCKLIFAHGKDTVSDKILLCLQTEGMFKSKIHEQTTARYKKKAGYNDVFCLSATDINGNIKWQIGAPYKGQMPYLSHAAEQMMTLGDINADGENEILLLDNDDNLLIVSLKGEVFKKIKLPDDAFSQVYYVKTGPAPCDFIIIIGVMDRTYEPHPYANPWLFLNNNFDIFHTADYLGAGHNILIDDVNKDGKPEIMIGYQLLDVNGQVLWTLDYWQDKPINSLAQHVDFIQGIWIDGDWFGTISGSDKQYFFNADGHCLWVKDLPHPQCCLFGKYNDEYRVFVANQREIMNSFDLSGKELWNGLLPEFWPYGKASFMLPPRPIHSNDPLNLIKNKTNDYILYKEGGHPYIIDFNGGVIKKILVDYKNHKYSNLYHRINDIGLSFEGEIGDIDADGQQEILIYNREFLWIYKI